MKSVWWVVVGAALAINGAVAAQEADLLPKAVLPNSKINLTKATIEAGRLVIQGTTATPNTRVTVDNLPPRNSTANKTFAFSLSYYPSDCVVELTTPSGTDKAVIAFCGKGVNFTGAWSAAKNYLIDDLVTLEGATWRAKRANNNKRPATASTDWETFAARGADGLRGPRGAAGPQGLQGIPGVQGPQGAQGQRGPQGLPGSANVVIVNQSCSGSAKRTLQRQLRRGTDRSDRYRVGYCQECEQPTDYGLRQYRPHVRDGGKFHQANRRL